jgi:hypothetical protein
MYKYYLTQSSNHNGSQPLDACASGYHMASLWEILDPSAVRYDPYWGDSRADSGQGPPTVTAGWVRTGYNRNNGSVPGQANCNAWTSTTGYGTVVSLPFNWTPASQDVHVWDAAFRACSNQAAVWCIADVAGRGICQEPLELACGQRVHGDTSGYSNQVSTYDCFPEWSESGPETAYAFALRPGSSYSVTAQLSDLAGVDLDLFLLSSDGCGGGQCATPDSFGNQMFTVESLAPGTYYLVVDGFEGAAGSYTLELSCTAEDQETVYLPVVLRHTP